MSPVRNSSGALNLAGIILKCNLAAEQRSIISNGVNDHRPPIFIPEALVRLLFEVCRKFVLDFIIIKF